MNGFVTVQAFASDILPVRHEFPSTLGVEAAIKALQVANLAPTELDLIICTSSSPEYIFPATACLIQDQIGATKAGAFDLQAACTGFIFCDKYGCTGHSQRLHQECVGYRHRNAFTLCELERSQYLHFVWRWCRRVRFASQRYTLAV